MNTNTIKAAFSIVVAAALLAGCGGKNKNKNGVVDGIDDGQYGLETIVDDDSGLAITGLPFDQTHTPATEVSVAPVYFGYDSYQLPGAEIAKIEQAASILRQNPSYVMIVEGHCDERGSNEYNLSLGEQRAGSVRNYLANLGIAPDRLQTRSFGEERPAVQGYGEEAWRLNRRGEFAFFK